MGTYQDEQINLGKAADSLELTELKLRQRFIDLDSLGVGPADLAEALAETGAVRAWFDDEAGR